MQHNRKKELEYIRLVYGADNCSGTVWKLCRCLIPIRRIPTHAIFYCLYYRLSEIERSDTRTVDTGVQRTTRVNILEEPYSLKTKMVNYQILTVLQLVKLVHKPKFLIHRGITSISFATCSVFDRLRLPAPVELGAYFSTADDSRQTAFVGMWCDKIAFVALCSYIILSCYRLPILNVYVWQTVLNLLVF